MNCSPLYDLVSTLLNSYCFFFPSSPYFPTIWCLFCSSNMVSMIPTLPKNLFSEKHKPYWPWPQACLCSIESSFLIYLIQNCHSCLFSIHTSILLIITWCYLVYIFLFDFLYIYFFYHLFSSLKYKVQERKWLHDIFRITTEWQRDWMKEWTHA